MTSVDELRQLMRAGRIAPGTRLDRLKFIGPYLYARLQARQVTTIDALVRHALTLTLPQLRAFLTDVAKNRHANQCAAAAYHVRDVNRAGFNTLRNLLDAVRKEWPNRYARIARLPRAHGSRDAPAALCSCRTTRAACAAARGCRYATARGRGLCVPTTRNPGFEGAGGFSGQRRRAALRNQGRTFVAGWRVPDPYQ